MAVFRPKPTNPDIQHSHPLAAGLCWYIPFMPGSNQMVLPAYGRLNPSAGDAPDESSGVYGPSRLFNGSSHYLQYALPTPLVGYTGPFTITAIVRTDELTSGFHDIVVSGNAWYLVRNTAALTIRVYSQSSVSALTLAAASEYVVSLVYTGTDGSRLTYVNGVLVNSAAFSGTRAGDAANLHVGRWTTASEYWNGPIHGLMNHNRALSAGEIALLHADPFAPLRPSPAAVFFASLAGLDSGETLDPPIFSPDTAQVWLDDTATNGAAVYTAIATGDEIVYSIEAGNTNSAFAIDSGTGAITVNDQDEIDNATTAQYTLTVRATNSGGSDDLTLTVDVFLAVSIDNDTFSVDEDADDTDTVDTVTFAGSRTPLVFAIIAGNTGNVFAIDSSGVITVNGTTPLDHETTPQYTLTVRVTDDEGATDTATITIDINDVNEAPVVEDQTFAIAEDAIEGASVGTVAATDVDDDTLSYAITAGNGDGVFAINSSTGEITIDDATPLDYATTPSYSLTVEVTDDGTGTLSDTATITINVSAVSFPSPEALPLVRYIKSLDADAIILPLQDDTLDIGRMSKTVTATGSPLHRHDGPTAAIKRCLRLDGSDDNLRVDDPDAVTVDTVNFTGDMATGSSSTNVQGIVRHTIGSTPVYIVSYGSGATTTSIAIFNVDGTPYPSAEAQIILTGAEIYDDAPVGEEAWSASYPPNHIGDIDIDTDRGLLLVVAEHQIAINKNGVNRSIMCFDPDTLVFSHALLFDDDSGGEPTAGGNAYGDAEHPTNQPSSVSGGIVWDATNDEYLVFDYTAASSVEVVRVDATKAGDDEYAGTTADAVLTKYTLGGGITINREGMAIDHTAGRLHVSTGASAGNRMVCVYSLDNGAATGSWLYTYESAGDSGQGIDLDDSADPMTLVQVHRTSPQSIRQTKVYRNNWGGVTLMGWFRLYDLTAAGSVQQLALALYGDTGLTPDPQLSAFMRRAGVSNNSGVVANSVVDASGTVHSEGAWVHLTMVCDGTTSLLYIDGVASSAEATLPAEVVAYDRLRVGLTESGTAEAHLDAAMVVLIHRALSATEVAGAFDLMERLPGGGVRNRSPRNRFR